MTTKLIMVNWYARINYGLYIEWKWMGQLKINAYDVAQDVGTTERNVKK